MTDMPSNVFSRNIKGRLPNIVKADGAWLEDENGVRYLDASGGAIVVNTGQGREEIADAVRDQILKCFYAHPTMYTTSVVEELAQKLASHAPEGIERFYFHSSGSEAVEASIKLARQIHLANGRPQRFRLISRWKSYHGLTFGAMSAMGRIYFQEPYAPMLSYTEHIHPPYCLRCSYGLTHPECQLRCATALEEAIQNVGRNVVSAFLAETVSGGTLAGYPPPPGYWQIIREICDKYQVLLIQDEVLCGMGRTGRWFASEHYDVIPDIVTMGKGISSGSIAISAVGVQAEHYNSLAAADGFVHGGTFSHHPVAAAAALANLKIIERENLIERADQLGKYIGEKLQGALGEHKNVGDVRGIGMLWGVEIVKDKKTLEPFPRDEQVTERLWQWLFERGFAVYKATALAGIDGDALILGPPFVIKWKEIDLLIEKMSSAFDEVLS